MKMKSNRPRDPRSFTLSEMEAERFSAVPLVDRILEGVPIGKTTTIPLLMAACGITEATARNRMDKLVKRGHFITVRSHAYGGARIAFKRIR